MSADMRKKENKMMAHVLRLHGDVALLRTENAELRRRIRLMLLLVRVGADAHLMADGSNWYISDLANLRRKLPRGRR